MNMDESSTTQESTENYRAKWPEENQELSRSSLVILIVSGLIIAAVATYGLLTFIFPLDNDGENDLQGSPSNEGGSQLPYQEPTQGQEYGTALMKNPRYEPGDTLLLEGDLRGAEQHYVRLLNREPDATTEGELWYRIALTKENSSDAITRLQHIVRTDVYTNDVKSRAVEAMGLLYMRAKTEQEKTAITEKIFAVDPYSTYMVDDNRDLAYRRLFEYASSFSPAVLADLYAGLAYIEAAEEVFLAASGDGDALDEDTRLQIDGQIAQAQRLLERATVGIDFLKDPIDAGYLNEAQETLRELSHRYDQAIQ